MPFALLWGVTGYSLMLGLGVVGVLHSPWVGYKVHSPHGENTLGSGTGVCEIKAVLSNLTKSLQPPSPLFQCWRACLCECKVVRNKSLVLREDGAEQGNIEIGGRGFPKNQRGQICVSGFYFANTGVIYGTLYRDLRLWRGQKHRRSLFSIASGPN